MTRTHLLLALLFGALALAGSGAANATHFDSDPSTGSFNPQMTVTVSQTVVNRPTDVMLKITQADHEDPPVFTRLRTPGTWNWAFGSTRQAQDTAGVDTTDCKKAIDGLNDSPNGTGEGTNVDYSKRTDAHFARAEKVGSLKLLVHADGITRPGTPAEWDGDIAFISYDSVAQTGTLCGLLIAQDTRVTHLPDLEPPAGSGTKDDIEGVTEIVFEFPLAPVTDGASNWWETDVDLTDTLTDSTLQQLNVSLIEFDAGFFKHSAGNWQAGGVVFSNGSSVSGPQTFQGIFHTCPADDPAFGACKSGRPDVNRTTTYNYTLVTPAVTAPASGTLTNVNPVSVTGTAEPGSSVQVFDGANPAGSPATADAGGNWTASVPLPDGSHVLGARVVDAGGQSGLSNTRTIQLDTTPPTPPNVARPAESDTVAGVNVTISGTAEIGSHVTVQEAGLPIGQTTAGPGGAWSMLVALAKGPHAIQANASDLAGNTGALSALRSFSVTTATPVVAAPAAGGATNAPTVTVNGTSEPSASIEVDEGGVPIGPPVLADASGAWHLDAALAEGSHTLTVVATKDGFASPPATRTFAVDFTAPPAPAITSPVDGGEVRTLVFTVRGTSEPASSVRVLLNGHQLGSTATTDGTGQWATAVNLTDGTYTLTAVATDRAGNVGPASDPITFSLHDPFQITAPAQNSLNQANTTVAGSADVTASEVRLYELGAELGRTPVVDGAWSTAFRFSTGTHTITARVLTNGVLGPMSAGRTFRVDADPPKVVVFRPSGYNQIGVPLAPVRGWAYEQRATDSGLVRVQVTYQNLITMQTFTNDATCDACDHSRSTTWQDDLGAPPGVYRVTAYATDGVGNIGSSSVTFVVIS